MAETDPIYMVDPNKETADYIFEYYWRCQVRRLDLISVEELKLFGNVTTFDKKIDKALRNPLVEAYLSIDKMCELYAQGVNIHIIELRDTKRIYDFCMAHLDAWLRRTREDFNCPNPPIRDLELIYEFANKVYVHAREIYVDEAKKEERVGLFTPFAKLIPNLQNPFNMINKQATDFTGKTQAELDRDEYFKVFKTRESNIVERF